MVDVEALLAEADAVGYKQKTYIHAAGSVIGNDAGVWNHKDPAMTTIRSTDSSGNLITAAEGDKNGKLEFDPQGNNVGFTDWWALSTQGTPDPTSGVEFPPFETIRNGQLVRYNADGIDVPPNFFFELSQFTFGGMFGLVEHISRVKIGETWRTIQRDKDPEDPHNIPGGETVTFKLRDVFVSSWALNMGDFGSGRVTDASVSGQQSIKKLPKSLFDRKQKLTEKELANLKSEFGDALGIKNGDDSCEDKLNELLGELGSKVSSIKDLAESFFSGKNNLFGVSENVSTIRVKLNGKWTAVGAPAGETGWNGSTFESAVNNKNPNVTTISTFLHEIFHATGRGATVDHEKLNKAVRTVLKDQDPIWNLDRFIRKFCTKEGFTK